MGHEIDPLDPPDCDPAIECEDFCCDDGWFVGAEWTINTVTCKALYDGEFGSSWISQSFLPGINVGDDVSVEISVLACGKLLVAVGSEDKDWITDPGIYEYIFNNIDDTYVEVYAQFPFGDCIVDYVHVRPSPCLPKSVSIVALDYNFYAVDNRFYEPVTNEPTKQCFRICSTFDQSNALFLFDPSA